MADRWLNGFLLGLLPALNPLAVRWANRQQLLILRDGIPLTDQEREIAGEMGVQQPERVRLLQVPLIPMPGGPILGLAARAAGFSSDQTSGLSLGYGIFIRADCWRDPSLVAHECVHTAQFERLGGMSPFLRAYVGEVLRLGYPNAPLEREAIEKSARVR